MNVRLCHALQEVFYELDFVSKFSYTMSNNLMYMREIPKKTHAIQNKDKKRNIIMI